ncbi:MAG: dethiobiotin synthase [Lentisphaerae bacterium GWF2_52_8]|nr:MAG: dethiobiotin synthase [Lentisphaerae bacterium GWF2_52_8]
MIAARHFFISGTDTGVGKTIVSAGIAALALEAGRRCSVMKPVQTGTATEECDLDIIRRLVPGLAPLANDLSGPYSFALPASPHLAARKANAKISPEFILEAFSKASQLVDTLLVEGAGGLCVPLCDEYLMLDLIRDMQIPAILVTRASLGTINHSLLSIDALRNKQIPIAGIIVNGMREGYIEEDNIESIARLGQVPILAVIPQITKLTLSSILQSFGVQEKLRSLLE